MNILLLSNLYPTEATPHGGIFVSHRIRSLVAQGHQVVAVPLRIRPNRPIRAARGLIGRTSSSLDDPGHLYTNVPAKLRVLDLVGIAMHHEGAAQERAAQALARWLVSARTQPSIIHAHGAYRFSAAGVARHLSSILRIPYVVTLHGSDVNYRMAKKPASVARELGDARHLFFVSAALERRAQELGLAPVPSSVVGNGFDPSLFRLESAGHSAQRRPETVAFVGDLAEVKGADRLAPLMERVHRTRPDVSFVVVGDGPLKSTLPVGAPYLSLRPRMTQMELSELFRMIKVLVIPSRNEGWPTVIKEAQACGAAVVGVNAGGIAEAIGDPQWVVEDGRNVAAELSDCVVRALGAWGDERRWASRAIGYTWADIALAEMSVIQTLT